MVVSAMLPAAAQASYQGRGMRLAGYVELVFPPGTCSLNSSALLDRIRGLGADAGGYVHEAGGRRVVAYRPLYNDVLAIHDDLVYVVEAGSTLINGSTHGFIGVYTLCCGWVAWTREGAGSVEVEELARAAARKQGWLVDRVDYPRAPPVPYLQHQLPKWSPRGQLS